MKRKRIKQLSVRQQLREVKSNDETQSGFHSGSSMHCLRDLSKLLDAFLFAHV